MATLEFKLSDIIGEGKNKAIQFGLGPTQTPETPVLAIMLKDDRIVEMRLAKTGTAVYGIQNGNESVVLYHRSGFVRVIDDSGKTVAEQKYEHVYAPTPQRPW